MTCGGRRRNRRGQTGFLIGRCQQAVVAARDPVPQLSPNDTLPGLTSGTLLALDGCSAGVWHAAAQRCGGQRRWAIPGGAEVARSRVRERVRLLAVAVGGAVIGIAVGWVLVQLLLAR